MIRTQETLFSIWCENGSLCNSECIIQYGQWNFGCFHDIFLHVEVPWKFHDSCQNAECCGWEPGNPMAQGPCFGLGTPYRVIGLYPCLLILFLGFPRSKKDSNLCSQIWYLDQVKEVKLYQGDLNPTFSLSV